MLRIVAIAIAVGVLMTGGRAFAAPGPRAESSTAADSVELAKLLDQFLAGAGVNDTSAHDRFWADDLIYTGSSGRRVSKADIMRDVRSAPPPAPTDPVTVYTAEDVRIRHLGDVALVAFRLVATTKTGEETQVARFLNTGTFAWREGRWSAVGWQATRMPLPVPEARAEVNSAVARFGHALFTRDTTALAALTTPGFVWTGSGGATRDRERFLGDVAARKLKAPGWSPDTAMVRLQGVSAVARGRAGKKPFALTLVNDGGEWRAAALSGAGR